MILLSKKNENELNEQEKLKLEIMKTIANAKGYNPEDKKINLDFRDGSTFEKAARFLIARFDIKYKTNKAVKEEKIVEETVVENKVKKPGRKPKKS